MTPLARIPSMCVNIHVMNASASVTDSVDVAAKIASVGTSTPAMWNFSSESGSGMKPSMLTTQMKIIRLAQYGNQRPHRLRRQALLGDLNPGDLVDDLAERLLAIRVLARLDPHQEDAEQDREQRAEEQVGDGLVDRHVDRPDVDRDPRVERPLLGRVELLLGVVVSSAASAIAGSARKRPVARQSIRFMPCSPRLRRR